ncbi:MAG TPA: ribosome maturation factor RimM [Vulgatibacter sp.]
MASEQESPSVFRIGRIARPHGVRGVLAITLDNPDSDSLFHVDSIRLAPLEGSGEGTRYDVRRAGPGRKGQVLLSLAGVDTVEAADVLRGREVLVHRDQLPALGEREYWHRDLLGMQAVSSEGTAFGRVAEIVDTAEVPVLVVQGEGGERFVPFADPYVIEVDLPNGRIVVAPPDEAQP